MPPSSAPTAIAIKLQASLTHFRQAVQWKLCTGSGWSVHGRAYLLGLVAHSCSQMSASKSGRYSQRSISVSQPFIKVPFSFCGRILFLPAL